MDNNQNHTTAGAEALASNFNVSELEPRHENIWAGGHDDTSIEHATPNNVKE